MSQTLGLPGNRQSAPQTSTATFLRPLKLGQTHLGSQTHLKRISNAPRQHQQWHPMWPQLEPIKAHKVICLKHWGSILLFSVTT